MHSRSPIADPLYTSPDAWPEGGTERVLACPVCGDPSRVILYANLTDRVYRTAPGTWTLVRCQSCQAAYLDPRPTRETIGIAYRSYATHAAPEDTLAMPRHPLRWIRRAARNAYANRMYGYALRPAFGLGGRALGMLPSMRASVDRWVMHLPRRDGRPTLLDVGCGNGAALIHMRGAGWQTHGVDLDPDAVAAARAAGLDVQQGMLDDRSFAPEQFDAVSLSHLIEHVHDPVQTLRDCRRVLKPGGVVWIATPNLASIGHTQFGANWRGLEPPRHLVLFTPAALERALRLAGFEDIRFKRPPDWAEFYYAASVAIRDGDDPRRPPPLRGAMRARARLANVRAWFTPNLSEELIVLARNTR